VFFLQDAEIKKSKGRRKLKDFRNESNNIFGYFVRNDHRNHVKSLKDPVLLYTSRYMKESGF